MNIPIKPFLNRIIIATWILELISGGLYFSFKEYFSVYVMLVPVYFFLLVTYFHISLIKAVEKRELSFVSKYMMYTGLKLFINLGALVGLVFAQTEFAIASALSFLFCYFFYTIFEVRELLTTFKK
ncbi:MAG: hypothetical protein HY951_18335 [Bacteroidia bacterium]|nr:hypothetical protein [Bacteroidia bacterium]